MSGIAIAVEAKVDKAQKDLALLNHTVGSISSEVKKATSGFTLMTKSIVGLGGIALILPTIKSIDATFTNIESKIRTITGSAEKFSSTFAGINAISKDTRSTLADTTDSFFRIASSMSESSLELDKILTATRAIQAGAVLAGGNLDGYRAAVMQLGQGLGSGVLRGEEFNSVIEQALPIAKAIGDSLGVSVGTLRRMANAGKLTSDTVFSALVMQSNKLQDKVNTLSVTIEQALRNLKETLQFIASTFDKASGFSAALSNSIVGLASKLQGLADVAFEMGLRVRRAIVYGLDIAPFKQFLDIAVTIFYPLYFAAKLFSKQFLLFLDLYGITRFAKTTFANLASYVITSVGAMGFKLYAFGKILRALDQQGFMSAFAAMLPTLGDGLKVFGKLLDVNVWRMIVPIDTRLNVIGASIDRIFSIIASKAIGKFATLLAGALSKATGFINLVDTSFSEFFSHLKLGFHQFKEAFKFSELGIGPLKSKFSLIKKDINQLMVKDIGAILVKASGTLKQKSGLFIAENDRVAYGIIQTARLLQKMAQFFGGVEAAMLSSVIKVSTNIFEAVANIKGWLGELELVDPNRLTNAFGFTPFMRAMDKFLNKLDSSEVSSAGRDFVNNLFPKSAIQKLSRDFVVKLFAVIDSVTAKIGAAFSGVSIKPQATILLELLKTIFYAIANTLDYIGIEIVKRAKNLVGSFEGVEAAADKLKNVASRLDTVKSSFRGFSSSFDFGPISNNAMMAFGNDIPSYFNIMAVEAKDSFDKVDNYSGGTISRMITGIKKIAKSIKEIAVDRIAFVFDKLKASFDFIITKVLTLRDKLVEFSDNSGLTDIVMNIDLSKFKETAGMLKGVIVDLAKDLKDLYMKHFNAMDIDTSSIVGFKNSMISLFNEVANVFNKNLAVLFAKPLTLNVSAIALSQLFPESQVSDYIAKQLNSVAKKGWRSFVVAWSQSANAANVSKMIGTFAEGALTNFVKDYTNMLPEFAGALMSIAGGIFRGFTEGLPLVGKVAEIIFNVADTIGMAGPLGIIGAFFFGNSILTTLAQIGILPVTLTRISTMLGTVKSFFGGSYGRRNATGGFENIFGAISNTMFNSARRSFSIGAVLLGADMLGTFDALFNGSPLAHSMARGLAVGLMLFGKDVPALVTRHILRPIAASLVMAGGSPIQGLLLGYLQGTRTDWGAMITKPIDSLRKALVSRMEGIIVGNGFFDSIIYGAGGVRTAEQSASSMFLKYETFMRSIQRYAAMAGSAIWGAIPALSSLIAKWTVFDASMAASGSSGGRMMYALFGKGGLFLRIAPVVLLITGLLAAFSTFADEAKDIPSDLSKVADLEDKVKSFTAPEIVVDKRSITQKAQDWVKSAANSFRDATPTLFKTFNDIALLPNKLFKVSGASGVGMAFGQIGTDLVNVFRSAFSQIADFFGPSMRALSGPVMDFLNKMSATMTDWFDQIKSVFHTVTQFVGTWFVEIISAVIVVFDLLALRSTIAAFKLARLTRIWPATLVRSLVMGGVGLISLLVTAVDLIAKAFQEAQGDSDSLIGQIITYGAIVVGVFKKYAIAIKGLMLAAGMFGAKDALLAFFTPAAERVKTYLTTYFTTINWSAILLQPFTSFISLLWKIPQLIGGILASAFNLTSIFAGAGNMIAKSGRAIMALMAASVTSSGVLVTAALIGVFAAAFNHLTTGVEEPVSGLTDAFSYFFDFTAAGLALVAGSFMLYGVELWKYGKMVKTTIAEMRALMVTTGLLSETFLAFEQARLWSRFAVSGVASIAAFFISLNSLMIAAGAMMAVTLLGAFLATTLTNDRQYAEIGAVIGAVIGFAIAKAILPIVGEFLMANPYIALIVAGVLAISTVVGYVLAGFNGWFDWSDGFLTQLGKIAHKIGEIVGLTEEPPDPTTGLSKRATEFLKGKGIKLEYDNTKIRSSLVNPVTKERYTESQKKLQESAIKAQQAEFDYGPFSDEAKKANADLNDDLKRANRASSKAMAESTFDLVKRFKELDGALRAIYKNPDAPLSARRSTRPGDSAVNPQDNFNRKVLGLPQLKSAPMGMIFRVLDDAKKVMAGGDYSPRITAELNKQSSILLDQAKAYDVLISKRDMFGFSVASSKDKDSAKQAMDETAGYIAYLTKIKKAHDENSKAALLYSSNINKLATDLKVYKIEFDPDVSNVSDGLTTSLKQTYDYLLEIDEQYSSASTKSERDRLSAIKRTAIEGAKFKVEMAKISNQSLQYQIAGSSDLGVNIPEQAKYIGEQSAKKIKASMDELKQLQADLAAEMPVKPVRIQLGWEGQRKEQERKASGLGYDQEQEAYDRIMKNKGAGEQGAVQLRNKISQQLFDAIKSSKDGYAKYLFSVVESLGSPVIDIIDQFGKDVLDTVANTIAQLQVSYDAAKMLGDYEGAAKIQESIDNLKNSIKTIDTQPLQAMMDLLDQGLSVKDTLAISNEDLTRLSVYGTKIAKLTKDLENAKLSNSPKKTKGIQEAIQTAKLESKAIIDTYRKALPSGFSNIYGRLGLDNKAGKISTTLFGNLVDTSAKIENLELDRLLKSKTLDDWKNFTIDIEKANIELERTKLLGPIVGEALNSAFSDLGVSDFNEMVAYGVSNLTELLSLSKRKQSINLDIKADATEEDLQKYIDKIKELADIQDIVARKRINSITTGSDISQAFSDAGASTSKAAIANYQYGASLVALNKKAALLKLDQAKPLTLQAAKENLKALADIDRQLAIYKKIVMNTKENFDSFKSIFDFSVDDTLYARLSNGILGLMGNVAARIDLLMKNASDKDGLSASTRSLYEALALVKRDAKTYSSLLTSVYEAQQSKFDSNKTKYDKISTAFPNLGMDKNLYGTLDRAVRSGFEKSANFSDLFSKISDLGALPVKLADELDRLGNLYASGKNVDIDMIAAAVTQYGEGNLKARLEAIMSSTKDPFTNLKTSTDDLKGAIELLSENVAANTATLRGEAPKAKTSMNMSSNVESLLAASTAKYGVPLDLARIVTHIESRGKNNLTSETGNKGLMQISDDLVKKYKVTNVWDPAQNIDAGVQYLKELLGKFGGDSRKAALGYFEGEGKARKALANPAGYPKGMDYLKQYDARLSGKTPMKFPDATITIPTGAIIDVSGTSNVTTNGESANAGSAATRNVSAFVESRIATANANKIVVNSWRQAIEGIKGTNLGMSLTGAIRKGLSTVGQDTMNASVTNVMSMKDVLVADEYKQTMTDLNDQLNTATDEITKANLQGTLNKVSAEFGLFKTRLEELATAAIKAGQDFSSAVKSTLGDAIKGLMKGETSDVSTLFSTALKKLRDGVIDATIDSMTKGIMNKLPFSFDKIMANAGEAIYKVPGAIWDSMSGKGFGGFTDIWGTLTGSGSDATTPEGIQLQAAKIQLQAAQMQLGGGGGGIGGAATAAASGGIGSWLMSAAPWLAGGAGVVGLGSLLYGKGTGSWSSGLKDLGSSFSSPFGGSKTGAGNPTSFLDPVSGIFKTIGTGLVGLLGAPLAPFALAMKAFDADAFAGMRGGNLNLGTGVFDSVSKGLSNLDPTKALGDISTKSITQLGQSMQNSLPDAKIGGLWDILLAPIMFLFKLIKDGFTGFISLFTGANSAGFGDMISKSMDSASSNLGGSSKGGGWGSDMFKSLSLATGGRVTGAGSGTSDSIPAMLSNGEFVVNAKATGKHRKLLESINSGSVSKFADGGFVSSLGKGLPLMGAVLSLGSLFFSGGGSKGSPKDQTPEQALLAAAENLNSAADKIARAGLGGTGSGLFSTGNGLGKGVGGFADSILGLGGYGSAAGGVLDALFGVKKKENDICSCFTGKGNPATSLFQDIFGLGGKKDPLGDPSNPNFMGPPAPEQKSMFSGMFDKVTSVFDDIDFQGMLDPLLKGFDNLFGGIGKMLGGLGSGGGIMDSIMSLGSLFMFASGGHVNGPGSGTSDSIPAMLSNGEFVINAKATAATRPLLEAINSGKTPKFALGGSVGDASGNLMTLPSARSSEVINTSRVNNNSNQSVINMNITGDISRQTRSEVFKMIPTIANGVNVHNKEQNYRG